MTAEGAQHDSASSDNSIREDVVQRLLHGFKRQAGPASMAEFIGVEFAHPPTDAEREEAHRRYVQDLVDHALHPRQSQ